MLAFMLVLCVLPVNGSCYAGLFNSNKPADDQVMNILVIGEDKYSADSMEVEENGNADGEIILSINKNTKKIILTSLARDSVLEMDGQQTTKATLIYHYYGKEALCSAIEESLGIHIDNTVIFNYLSVIDIVDAFGGVEMELSANEVYFTNSKITQMNTLLLDEYADADLLEKPSGMFHLNGKQAAAYMRIRISDETNNDFGRTDRARKVVLALKDKAMETGKIKLIGIAKKVIANVEYDFSLKELFALVGEALDYKDYEMISQCVPAEGTYHTGEGYVYMDLEANRKMLQDTIYGTQ